MKHVYSDYISEIEEGVTIGDIKIHLKPFIEKNILINSLGDKDKLKLYEFLYFKLAAFYGGYSKVYGVPEEKPMVVMGFKTVVDNMTTHDLFAGLYEILSGKTKYKSFCPKPAEFQAVCRTAPKIQSSSNLLLESIKAREERAVSREEVVKHVAEIKKILLEKKEESRIQQEKEHTEKFEQLEQTMRELEEFHNKKTNEE